MHPDLALPQAAPSLCSPRVTGTFYSAEHEELQEYVSCPCCGATEAELYRSGHDRLFHQPGTYRVLRCTLCAMIYTNPRPTAQALARHYPKDYFCYAPPDELTGLRGVLLRAATRGLTERRIRLLESVTGKLTPNARVCDVGCSHGALLRELQCTRGCDVVGVDFDQRMVDYAESRGVPVRMGTLQNARFAGGEFDIVTMTEYLEHEPDPASVLAECARVTKPGGHLLIEVPLIASLSGRLFRGDWSQLDLPRHLMFFTPAPLTRMLDTAGYDVVSVRTLTGSLGVSVLYALGYDGVGRMTTRDMLATLLVSLPLLPVLPLVHEFMLVVARARGAVPKLQASSSTAPNASAEREQL